MCGANPLRQRLGKSDRLTKRRDLRRVFRRGRFAADALIQLRMLPNDLSRSRMAVVVSTRHGPAVARNRIKRLCREAFRTVRADLPPGYDYVVRPSTRAELSVEGLRRSLRELSGRIAKESKRCPKP